jgi:hypothetical protein
LSSSLPWELVVPMPTLSVDKLSGLACPF